MKKIILCFYVVPLFLTACAENMSRRWCPPQEMIVEKSPVVYKTESIQLSVDVLFKFDKA